MILSGHIDSSWCWLLPVNRSHLMRYKIYYGFGGVAVLLGIAVIRILESYLGEGLGTGVSFAWLFGSFQSFYPAFILSVSS